jgi:mannitol/fructose-specific phosphotransferase system IIA component (Ntr-type)
VKLHALIPKAAIVPVLQATDKKGVITELVQAAKKASKGERFGVAPIVEAILKREKMGSTGIGGGVAIPHAKLAGVKGLVGAFGRTPEPVDFNAVDGEKVQLVFVILAPESKAEEYLQTLRGIMAALKRPNFVKFLKGAKTAKDIETIFREAEEVPV